MLKLRFPKTKIHYWASLYPVDDDSKIEEMISPAVRSRGYYTKSELAEVFYWKTPRTIHLVRRNPDDFVEKTTICSLSAIEEKTRIKSLTALNGVGWPTASVLLHFGHRDPYPILDFRALWSLGLDYSPAVYTFHFWWEYVHFCRNLAEKSGVSMRTLDRALWQYSKENQ